MDLDISQYISIFIEESKEHLQVMNDVLLELEKDLSHTGYINEIFRVAHTLKGMSGTMGFHNMANLTHEMENVLQATRSKELMLSDEVIDILFECFDALELSINNISEEGTESSDMNEDLIEKLRVLLNEESNVKLSNIKDKTEIDSYVIEVIEKAKADGLKTFKIDFILSDSCMLMAARAFIIFNTLEKIGEIVYSNPSVEDIEDEKFKREFSIIIITEYSKDSLSKELSKISEIEDINILEDLNSIIDKEKNSTNNLAKDKIKIDSYVIEIIEKAKEDGLDAFKIDFVLNDACMLKAARAFIIFNTLEEIGEIVYSNPSVEDIEDEKFEREFSIIIITKDSKEIISNELNKISEVEDINIKLFEDYNYKSKQEETFSNKDKEHIENKEVKDKNISYQKSGKVTKTVRVDIERLDNLMNLVSELIIIKTRMDDVSENSTGKNMSETIEYLERITTSLHDAVMKVRMVPIERVFNRFPRLVRDLSKELGKDIHLEMTGEDTEVDRTVIDEIGDPLIHLIRNSIDHGIELPEERLKMGKDRMGKVILKSYPDGNNVVIEVDDDGKGINHKLIKKKAIEKGLIDEKQAENLTKEESMNLLFEAGLSTSETISDVSGRGVGLDVVKSKIESINGNIEIQSSENKGTRFIIRIPLTLAIIQALLIKLSDEIYAIPLSSITEIINIESEGIKDVQCQEVILYRGETLPIVRLSNIFGTNIDKENKELIVVVVKKGEKQAGLIVDDLIGQQEIVIKGLSKYLSKINYLSGATILGNGNISLIIDVNSLI